MSTQRLKLGLLIDTFHLPAWAYRAVERIVASRWVELSLVVVNEINSLAKDGIPSGKETFTQENFAYRLFDRIDERLFLREPNAFQCKDLRPILTGIPVLQVKPESGAEAISFDSQDIERIKAYRLDILVHLGFQPLAGDIFSAAAHGVWFYEFCDNRLKQGGPPGFWEVIEKWPETGTTLCMRDAVSHHSRSIYRSSFLTYPFSPVRNRNTMYWAASSFLPRQIELLARLGQARFIAETQKYNLENGFPTPKVYHFPGTRDSLLAYARLFLRILVEQYHRIFDLDTWFLLLDVGQLPGAQFGQYKKLLPPKDRFWADPHIVQKDGSYFIFVEELFYKDGKGHLAVIEVGPDGVCKDPLTILEKDYHLSYPNVFEHAGRYYMVPETSQNQTIDLYECVSFPAQWEYKMTLMQNVSAVDTTLFFYTGKWWLFTGLTENEGALPEVELFLFYSDDLFTADWKPHILNPVISDVTSARPAGKIFFQDGKIYRPSQDCSKTYGYGFNINEVIALTETEYQEKKVSTTKPHWDSRLIATHTYAHEGKMTVIDALFRRSKFL
jgi:hypothetical protein